MFEQLAKVEILLVGIVLPCISLVGFRSVQYASTVCESFPVTLIDRSSSA